MDHTRKNNNFLKYPSIENHYREQYIEGAIAHGQINGEAQFIVQEKIHGANISFLFEKEKPFRVFSRNHELNIKNPMFYNLGSYLKDEKFMAFLRGAQFQANYYDISIRFYGEFFGGNIQKGVDYGPNQRILFYDVMINDKYFSTACFEEFLEQCDRARSWKVPDLGTYPSLKEALEVDCNRNSLVGPSDNIESDLPQNTMEGVVIKSYFDFQTDQWDRPFYIKKKNDEFLEKTKAKKPKPREDKDPMLVELKAEFCSYFTENRLDSVCSKMGPITEPQQIGDYIKAMYVDVFEDFNKDFGPQFEVLTPQDKKFVTSAAGKLTVPMIRKRL